ncbi:hypothetical protein Glove_209g100 [Diversispora epigaea]|uniref:Uncharacterized protein n=1 Tax=Diversispora epigaea TaxID=1348612 RepID=A0A397IT34_9GLOM|nr:hypothetical protein Glove_209g100 [Diversispora epigaea]
MVLTKPTLNERLDVKKLFDESVSSSTLNQEEEDEDGASSPYYRFVSISTEGLTKLENIKLCAEIPQFKNSMCKIYAEAFFLCASTRSAN